MKYYNNVFRPIAPPVDMSILQNTYNTLEQGHLKGVELASKLRSEIAQLPLNESEQGYKDELASGIEQVITENSFNENAYYAIPDLVKAQGDIMSNPVLLNKIQAQADYKAFQDSIEANKEMPGDMKEYYKELNPYKSGQQEDGSYDTSFKWTPNASPKMIVSLADMVTKGIARAAKESGGGTVSRWIDSNGNITTDPSKAYDGEVYNATTNRWERLSRKKILAGIQSVIAETPGAAESLKQDYDVAIWKLGKQAKTDANGNPIVPVSDVTDPNGIPLTESEYLLKRIEPAIAAAQYYNNISNTTYGNGLATYKAAQAKATASAIAQSSLANDVLTASGRGMIIEMPSNPAGDAINNMNTAKNEITKLYKKYTGKDANPTTYSELVGVLEDLGNYVESNNITVSENISSYSNLLRMYKSAEDTLNSFTEGMSDKDKADFNWANRILNNGQLIRDASKHDNKILDAYSDKFDENGNLGIVVSNETLNRFREYITNPADYGIKIIGNTISINKSNQNYIPQILNYIAKSYDDTVKSGGYKVFSNTQNQQQAQPKFATSKEGWFKVSNDFGKIRRVSNEYNKAQEIVDKYSKKYSINPQDIDVDVTGLQGQTWGHNYLEKQYNLGIIDGPTYEKKKQDANETIDRFLATTDLTQYQIWEQGKDNKGHIVTSPSDRAKITADINSAHKDKRIEYTPAFAPGAIDPLHNELGGYYITIYDDDTGKKVKGKYYIPGFGGESARVITMTNPEVIAANELAIMAQTGTSQYLSVSEENPILGNVRISPISTIAGLEVYNVDIWGSTIPMTKGDASKFAVAMEQYYQIKNYYISGGEVNERLQNALTKICTDIAETTNLDIEVVAQKLGQDIEQ